MPEILFDHLHAWPEKIRFSILFSFDILSDLSIWKYKTPLPDQLYFPISLDYHDVKIVYCIPKIASSNNGICIEIQFVYWNLFDNSWLLHFLSMFVLNREIVLCGACIKWMWINTLTVVNVCTYSILRAFSHEWTIIGCKVQAQVVLQLFKFSFFHTWISTYVLPDL